jgi:hypothetical protein
MKKLGMNPYAVLASYKCETHVSEMKVKEIREGANCNRVLKTTPSCWENYLT